MEQHTISNSNDFTIKSNMYNGRYDFDQNINTVDVNNKLFCTFVNEDEIDLRLESISNSYDIMYNKMFVLFIKSTGEYVITYNVEQGNVEGIYTINALNTLIKSLNGGIVDPKFRVDWQHYRNCILLTQGNEIKQLNTKVHKIIEL